MAAILGYADLIEADLDDGAGPGQIREAVRSIRRNGQHLLTVINTILDVSGISSGITRVERRPTPVAEICRAVLDGGRVRAGERPLGIRAVFAGDSVPAVITADPERLRQTLSLLMSNAVRFTEHGGVELRVGVRDNASGGREIRFDMIDSGSGMSAAQVAQLADPAGLGATGAGDTDKDAAGARNFAGLGLHICHAYAQLMGGRLEIRSEPGAGSRFTLVLDLSDTDAASEPVRERTIGVAAAPAPDTSADLIAAEFLPLAGARVLLVEDGKDNQILLRFLLGRAGADVELAADGLESLEYVGSISQNFDIVLMDMHMPNLDGFAATRALRQRGCGLPIVALTAHAMPGDREACMAAGCDDYLSKPIDRTILVQTCKRWLLGDLSRAA
jgi:CheY-like chemotaxis protein